ncbi:MAG: tRNA (adenosine(37)-N6)-dimethylallyltransferase MiaA [Bacteroidia bacterium]|nr:tRNA (adenosine(37)-N6)-dimethylallyltransferase MiaA [Bacteroidia bacterium]
MAGNQKYLIVIAGPTAVGKTNIAIELAKTFNTVILSADSRQIYKELNIGVAKPSAEQLQEVKHYFISHVSITEDYSAYDYQKEVHQLLSQIFKEKDIAIMCGGTGFYINAVLNGLNELPQISGETKDVVKNLLKEKGLLYLQNELKRKDPLYYQKADVHNPARVCRALEIIYETGRPFSDFLNDQLIQKPSYFIPVNLFLNMNRSELYERINQRVIQMIETGLEAEARSLYLYKNLKALNTVGYKEWWKYVEGTISLQSVIEQIQRNTRQYAKRQITWFKHQWKAKEIKIKAENIDQSYNEILLFIQGLLK